MNDTTTKQGRQARQCLREYARVVQVFSQIRRICSSSSSLFTIYANVFEQFESFHKLRECVRAVPVFSQPITRICSSLLTNYANMFEQFESFSQIRRICSFEQFESLLTNYANMFESFHKLRECVRAVRVFSQITRICWSLFTNYANSSSSSLFIKLLMPKMMMLFSSSIARYFFELFTLFIIYFYYYLYIIIMKKRRAARFFHNIAKIA